MAELVQRLVRTQLSILHTLDTERLRLDVLVSAIGPCTTTLARYYACPATSS
jgi:hypothetical protein